MLVLPDDQRHLFREPFGTLYSSLDQILPLLEGKIFFSVGDVVTSRLLCAGYHPFVAIIDGQTMRRPYEGIKIENYRVIHVKNPAGCISSALSAAAHMAAETLRVVVQVDGEEDLAVLPLAQAAPVGSLILYGQPGEGVVVLEVSTQVKEQVSDLLGRFELAKEQG